MLNGGISSSAMRIAGQVSPHAKLSATSISFAVAVGGFVASLHVGTDVWNERRTAAAVLSALRAP